MPISDSRPTPPDFDPPPEKVPLDPGLSQTYYGQIRRIINKDGTFNVRRTGTGLKNLNIYQYLLVISWTRFLVIIIAGFFVVNSVFAGLYLLTGIQHLNGADSGTAMNSFFSAFFFSAETFTTVGYGNISPSGLASNFVAALEAAMGLMSFALAAALLFGRFSRPHAKLVYSDYAVIAPYQGGRGLMFRVVNKRSNLLLELETRVLLMTVEHADHGLKRVYRNLDLERSAVDFLPLTWTIVHPIDQNSPLYGMEKNNLAVLQAEILLQIRGFDDTFNQWVHSRYSYRYDEIAWGARFLPAFHVDDHGETIVDVELISRFEEVELPEPKDESRRLSAEGTDEILEIGNRE
jgi:inward rectifier potassium channel